MIKIKQWFGLVTMQEIISELPQDIKFYNMPDRVFNRFLYSAVFQALKKKLIFLSENGCYIRLTHSENDYLSFTDIEQLNSFSQMANLKYLNNSEV